MKNKSSKTIICLTSSLMMLGAITGCRTQITVWTHYKANAPTEEARGNIEFWIGANNKFTTRRPTVGKIVEAKSFDPEKFAQYDIWIENELKVTKGDSSFVVPLADFPELYYNANGNYADAELKIIKDVTLEGTWTAIGSAEVPFSGVFDGNDKTISALTINNSEISQGLFGVASGATFKNLKLADVDINANGLTGAVVGFIHGGDDVLVENCHVLSGSIKSTLFDDLGGLIGGIYDPTKNVVVKNCSNAARVESAIAPGRVGGMIGIAGPTVSLLLENCVNSGVIVSSNSSAMVGGTRGQAKGATFTFRDCANTGTANVPYVGFYNSAAGGEEYLKVVIENTSVTESLLPSLFSSWQSGGSEGGILRLTINGDEYRYCLIPTYTYSVTQGKMVSLAPVYSVEHPLNQQSITTATEEEWAEFLALGSKIAVYNEDGSFRGVSPTTNCYAPNSYYIKGAQFGGFVNTWVKVVSSN